MNQLDPKTVLILWLFFWAVIWLCFGFATSVMGSSFWWGFLFGPIGLIVAAVLVSGRRQDRIVVVNAGERSRVRIRRPGDPPAERSSRKETEMEEFNRRFDEGFARR